MKVVTSKSTIYVKIPHLCISIYQLPKSKCLLESMTMENQCKRTNGYLRSKVNSQKHLDIQKYEILTTYFSVIAMFLHQNRVLQLKKSH